MNGAMERVTGDVPVACEYALSRRWSKKAKAVFDERPPRPLGGSPMIGSPANRTTGCRGPPARVEDSSSFNEKN